MRNGSCCSLHNLVLLQGCLVLLNSKRSHKWPSCQELGGSMLISIYLNIHSFHTLPFLG